MDFYEFLDAVFMRFPPRVSGQKDFDDCYSEYRAALESSIDYDYEAAYNDLCANYPYTAAPFINTLKQYMMKHIRKQARADSGLSHIREIKQTPRFRLEDQTPEYQARIYAKLEKIGIRRKNG